MSKGKYYSLEEARKDKNWKEFARQHPSTGNKKLFDKLLDAMVKKHPKDDQTSS